MTRLLSLVRDRTGTAAVEMALVLPVLMPLLFGAMELGNYFWSEHTLQKAVRDAARYAARLPMTDYTFSGSCPNAYTPTATTLQQIQRVAKAGDPDGDFDGDGTQDARLAGWTSDSMTTVTVTCDTSGTYTGIYSDFPHGVPVVTVSATVPYDGFFGSLGFIDFSTFNLNATDQAAMMGA